MKQFTNLVTLSTQRKTKSSLKKQGILSIILPTHSLPARSTSCNFVFTATFILPGALFEGGEGGSLVRGETGVVAGRVGIDLRD